MGRGPKPAKPKVQGKDDGARVRALEKRLAEALKLQTEAQEQQAATAEILRVISSSPTDYQPVFNTIVRSAGVVCGAVDAILWTVDGDELVIRAHHGPIPGTIGLRQPLRGTVAGYAAREARIVQVEDLTEADDFPVGRDFARRFGWRTALGAPLLRGGVAIGAILIRRSEVRPFTEKQIALLETFADQAVIAIENVRLFTELQDKNKALTVAHAQVTESLEQQTVTSEILRVIASSPTDMQPVFEIIAANAARLCAARDAQVLRVEGNVLRLVSAYGSPSMPPVRALSRGHAVGRAVIDRQTIHVRDMAQAVAEFPETSSPQHGVESLVAVPLLREDVAVGVIRVSRTQIQPFTEQQIALLRTFADQAVIAIENVRLFKELEEKNRALTQAHAQVSEALEQQTATSQILQTIAQAQTNVQPVFDTIVRSAVRLCDAVMSNVQLFDGEFLHWVAQQNVPPETMDSLRRLYPMRPDRRQVAGRAVLARTLVHLPDVLEDPEYQREMALKGGWRSVLSVPMMRAGDPIGALTVAKLQPFSDTQIALLRTFADQAVIAIENVRLFKELESANRDLAAASQHKSEFLANMSHELRTPLNAIIGFSEVLTDRMFGELNEKQEEYLKDIYASGTHLLSLINDILDLSKIEAGRMELELSDFHLPTALDSALTLVRERAGRRGIALQINVDERLGEIQADERKVRQVVLNLLSNAIKFTPQGGRIDVRAIPQDGLVEVSVSDTGVGIAPEDQDAVFEEFRQVGAANKKVEGTGLGLTLCRKFVELHGGRIWVKSQVGEGSTFTFTIPVRHGE